MEGEENKKNKMHNICTHSFTLGYTYTHIYLYAQAHVRTSEYVNRGEQDGECAQPLSGGLEEYNIEVYDK